ncbi:hypothetical protein [Siminovitchia sp. FSL W7-1587]|uniref:hypothetical protein n=1 Tax=Siminovitchia sp. FSL W7-1587 TaxID=2954699 RepID=UPI0030CD2A4F
MMEMNPIQQQLQQPETQKAIVNLLVNLPTYQKNMETLGEWIDFGKAVLQDKQSLNQYDELIRSYNLDLETVEALISLLEKLPRLNELIEKLDNFLEFGEAILHDEASLEYAAATLKSYADPVVEKGRQGLRIVKDIQQKAQADSEPIKLITILKWLKEPSVQQGLKYVQATLTTLNKTI